MVTQRVKAEMLHVREANVQALFVELQLRGRMIHTHSLKFQTAFLTKKLVEISDALPLKSASKFNSWNNISIS